MSRLKTLRLSNFKSIGAEVQEIEFAPITLLFGPNSAGKSTVLQALVYARDAILHGNMDPDSTDLGGDWLDLGGFKNIVHGRNPEATVGLGFELEISSSDIPNYLTDHESDSLEEHHFYQLEDLFADVESLEVDLQIRWSKDFQRPFVETYSCKLDGNLIVVIRASSDGKQIYIDQMPLLSHIFRDPVDFLDDNRSLAEIITESLNISLVGSAERAMKESVDADRPYRKFTIDELEDLVDDNYESVRQEVIDKLLEELSHRTSRRAAKLEEELRSLSISDSGSVPLDSLSINLKGQQDALPLYASGLIYEDSVWSSLDEDVDSESHYNKAIQLLIKRVLDTAICGPLGCVAFLLEEMTYIGPLRDLPPRRIEVPKSKSTSRWAKGLAAWEALPGMEKDDIDEINFWMGESCLNSGYQVRQEKVWEVQQEDFYNYFRNSKTEVNRDNLFSYMNGVPEKLAVYLEDQQNGLSVMPHDIGVGISQLFPVVAASVHFDNTLISIEQPELHVHPRLQTQLADMFIRNSLGSGNQFLLETHSEHLMLRLLRRIRDTMKEQQNVNQEGVEKDSELDVSSFSLALPEDIESLDNIVERVAKLTPADISVHYVEPTKKGTKFTKLRVSDDGDFLDEWPDGFFDERDDEVFF